jgi:DNA-binding CsgD family transcriptional regulator
MKKYIYCLKDCDSIFYIGQTQNVKMRLRTHISQARLLRNDKDAKIKEIVKDGRLPIIEVLQECADHEADELECKYITQHFENGSPLVNSVLRRVKRRQDILGKVLKPVEITILKLMAEDCTAEQIRDEVNLSTRTIETKRMRIKDKLGVKTIAGMVIAGIKKGYIKV